MNIKVCNKDIVIALVAGFVGATISSTMLPQASYGYVSGHGFTRPSARDNAGTINRDTDVQILEQERRMARLRALQEEETMYGSAPEEVLFEALNYVQARRQCRIAGYQLDRSRFSTCVESYMQTGQYHIDY